MRNAAAGLVLAFVLAAAGAARAEDAPLVVSDGDARAEIAESDGGLSIALTVGAKSRTWRYPTLTLDPEETGAPAASWVAVAGRRVLFVQVYSGGAHCCWSLLAFDAGRLKALGPVLDSQSSIELGPGDSACAAAAVAEPIDRKKGLPTRRLRYCFEGGRYRSRGPARP